MTTTPTPPPAAGPHHGPYDDGSHGPRVSGEQMRDLASLRRSSTDKHVSGLAGGLGRHLDIDPVIVRVVFVVLTFFGGAGLLAYALGWILVPRDDSNRAVLDLDGRSRGFALAGVGVLAALLLLGDLLGDFGWFPWPLLLVALLVWLVFSNRGERRARREAREQGWLPPSGPAYASAPVGTAPEYTAGPIAGPAAEPAGPSAPDSPYGPGWTPSSRRRPRNPRKRGPILFWFTLALIALTIGTLGVFDLAGLGVTDAAYPASALAIIAGMLVVGAFYGRAGGLILLGLIATLVTAGTTAASEFDGEQISVTPTTSSSLKSYYEADAGELTVDLTQVEDLDELDGRTLRLDVELGRIEVVVPDGLGIEVDGRVEAGGSVDLFGLEHEGWDFTRSAEFADGSDSPTLNIDADMGMGEIVVRSR